MTDARFPERWLNDRRLLRLSDNGFRLFVSSLIWSVANRTDGVLDDEDLALMRRIDAGQAPELEKAGLWQRVVDTWIIVDFAETQTSADDLATLQRARQAARERQRRKRERDALSRDSHGDGSRDTTRTGQDRPGQDRQELYEGEPESWPAVTKPGEGRAA